MKKLLAQRVKELEKSIHSKEVQRVTTDPASLPTLDKEIRQLKRYLKHIQEAANIREMEERSGEKPIDEITKAKIIERKLYEDAAAAGIDFNDRNNPVLVSARRLGLTNELVDILSDAVNLHIDNIEIFPAEDYFTKPLDTVIESWEKRISQAKAKVNDAKIKQKEIEKNLQEAKINGNVDDIIALTDQLEDAGKIVQCLEELLNDEEETKPLSNGASLAAWEKVCEVYGYEWRNRLQTVILAAQIYHDNLQLLNELNNSLWMIRNKIRSIGEKNGDPNNINLCQRITCNVPDVEKVMKRDEVEQLVSAVYFHRGEML